MFFFSAAEKDYRIGPTHLGLFAALLHYSARQGFINPIRAFNREIMAVAKIAGANTYSKHIRELNEYGYLRFEPSFKKNKPSCIYLFDMN